MCYQKTTEHKQHYDMGYPKYVRKSFLDGHILHESC